jgi:hypothetical protein
MWCMRFSGVCWWRLDALLRHESGTPLHAAIASGVLFLINGALVLYVFSFDRKIKQR